MIISKTKIEGVYILTPELRKDSRGYFARVFAKEELEKAGISFSIVHINSSLSRNKGLIRGIHYQKAPKEESKIIQCLKGKIFDVAVDLRKNSKTYGQWVGETLDSKNEKLFLIPKGCAHGFQVLEENTITQYFVSEYYNPAYETGIRWNDLFFNITWPIKNVVTSKKDSGWLDYVRSSI